MATIVHTDQENWRDDVPGVIGWQLQPRSIQLSAYSQHKLSAPISPQIYLL